MLLDRFIVSSILDSKILGKRPEHSRLSERNVTELIKAEGAALLDACEGARLEAVRVKKRGDLVMLFSWEKDFLVLYLHQFAVRRYVRTAARPLAVKHIHHHLIVVDEA